MWMFLVSGTKKKMKRVMTKTNAPKNKKIKYLRWHNMVRNTCAMTKVTNMFTDTLMLCPADLISSGKISLGTNHPNGPHDHAKPET